MNKRSLSVILVAIIAFAQVATSQTAESERLDRYMKFAHPLGTVRMEFLGPDSGYTFLVMPTKETTETGDTVVKDHAYLLDLNFAHDGGYLAPDTMKTFSDYTTFEFQLTKDHLVHLQLAPGHTHEEYKALDTTFNGTLGYGFIKQFVSVFNFKKNTLTLYPLFANLDIAPEDPKSIQLPLLDDAKITYCGCSYPSIWLEVEAPPLTPGHVNLAFHRPLSQVFVTALDKKTQNIIAKQAHADSLANRPGRPLGLNLSEFTVGKGTPQAQNIAGRGPHREIAQLPAQYHDLSIATLGTLGTDVLRTFSGLIIDPSRNKLVFVK